MKTLFVLTAVLLSVSTTQVLASECPQKIEVTAKGFTSKSSKSLQQADLKIVLKKSYDSYSECQYQGRSAVLFLSAQYSSITTYEANLEFEGASGRSSLVVAIEKPTATEIKTTGKAKYGSLSREGSSDGASSTDWDEFHELGTVKSVQLKVLQ